ncbi:two-component sensor histidine kinase [Cnuibacter physcomitrellae]|uniref:Sensor histidine kinase MtrB n=1 Tax=Cnuibacter physcomitrellae TaxID=1619308 RepID=A0A1X9LL86_9MICO|nr:MtrAB system histidine kinase MtrB [Cnuibacter physcomitrellae]ARJ05966.1 two-component sensor histidine kinase [Cnuibacter physcomitrellae]MCS5496287.1 MtrAB system histidine kinase MtrB [Cnuibacter physcomitrellae]GGI36902.1 two-component sensor histidine kinase [Cnuibacter physcomitrellae]
MTENVRRSRVGPTVVRTWRRWPLEIARAWRRSLQFRTIVVTVALSTVAVVATGTYMSISIGNDLFQSRLNQVVTESRNAATAAQNIFDAADAASDASTLSLLNSAKSAIIASSSSRLIALLAIPGQTSPSSTVLSFSSPELTGDVISDQLQDEVAASDGGTQTQYWQSVSLADERGDSQPGIIVGTPLSIPGVGNFQLYIGYNLADAEQTLVFVQQTLWLGGLALIVLIGLVSWVIVRLVVEPIRLAAETSEKLAAGELEVRIPERGEDVISTLARSFNGMADSMAAQINQLAELSQVQQRFVSDVSHELRTPLTTIRLAGDMLYDQRSTFPPATERTAELLHTQTKRFEEMLSDLLEISRFDAGSASLDTEPTSLVRLAEDAADQMRSLAEQAGSDLRVVAPGGYTEVEMDPRRIRRIVLNLIGNAIEHGERRPVVITVDSSPTAVALSVRDYGVGMSPEDAERVFDRFWRADPSRKRTIGGTGLGLAISLEDATLHGGALEVWSAPGEGSNFRLTLPRRRGVTRGPSPLPLEPDDVRGAQASLGDVRRPEGGDRDA